MGPGRLHLPREDVCVGFRCSQHCCGATCRALNAGPCHQLPNCRHAFPLQVRNLRSSIKVALDFVSPDAVAECLELRGEFRCGASCMRLC